MTIVRIIITVISILLAILFAAVTLTIPAFAATAPAIITIFLIVVIYFAWPTKSRRDSRKKHIV